MGPFRRSPNKPPLDILIYLVGDLFGEKNLPDCKYLDGLRHGFASFAKLCRAEGRSGGPRMDKRARSSIFAGFRLAKLSTLRVGRGLNGRRGYSKTTTKSQPRPFVPSTEKQPNHQEPARLTKNQPHQEEAGPRGPGGWSGGRRGGRRRGTKGPQGLPLRARRRIAFPPGAVSLAVSLRCRGHLFQGMDSAQLLALLIRLRQPHGGHISEHHPESLPRLLGPLQCVAPRYCALVARGDTVPPFYQLLNIWSLFVIRLPEQVCATQAKLSAVPFCDVQRICPIIGGKYAKILACSYDCSGFLDQPRLVICIFNCAHSLRLSSANPNWAGIDVSPFVSKNPAFLYFCFSIPEHCLLALSQKANLHPTGLQIQTGANI